VGVCASCLVWGGGGDCLVWGGGGDVKRLFAKVGVFWHPQAERNDAGVRGRVSVAGKPSEFGVSGQLVLRDSVIGYVAVSRGRDRR